MEDRAKEQGSCNPYKVNFLEHKAWSKGWQVDLEEAIKDLNTTLFALLQCFSVLTSLFIMLT